MRKSVEMPKKRSWTPEEDGVLTEYVLQEGEGRWRRLAKRAGLCRSGRSCRLRWMNYLRPSIKRGKITPEEEDLILRLHRLVGNRWALIAGRIPGRTDNDIKNYWNTCLSKKLISQGIDPKTHKPLNPRSVEQQTNFLQEQIVKKDHQDNKTSTDRDMPPQRSSQSFTGKESCGYVESDDQDDGLLQSLLNSWVYEQQ